MSVKNLYPTVRPTLIEDFTQTRAFGPYTTFNRTEYDLPSAAFAHGMIPDITGELKLGSNQPMFDFDPLTHESLGLVRAGGDTQFKSNSSSIGAYRFFETSASYDWQHFSVLEASEVSGASDIAGPGSRSIGYGTNDTEGTFVESNSWADQFELEVSNLTTNDAYTLSIYAKSISQQWLVLYIRDESDNSSTHSDEYCFFNLSGNGSIGTVSDGTASIKKVNNDGWFRVSWTFTYDGFANHSGVFNDCAVGVYPNRSADNTFSETSFATTQTYFWGLTFTEGSYIAPFADGDFHDATVTMSHDEWWVQNEGTIIYETSINQYSSGIGTQERLEIPGVFKLESSGTGAPVFTATASSDTYTHGSAVTTMKEAIAYQANDVVYALNGSVVKTITSYTPPAVSADIKIADNMHGNLKKITYYPTRLTNAQIELLTS